MIRAANVAWASLVALALGVASPAFAGRMKGCAARGATNRTSCRANSAKAAFVDPGQLGLAIAAVRGGDVSALRTGIDANARLADDTLLTGDPIEQGQGAAETAFMRALESKPVSIGSRIRRLRAGAANAAANAMSGDVFRGDTGLHLTGNMASYGGTRSGGIQMGALVFERLALNAGVTKGFNKVRETVGRVGITLGW